MDARLILHGAGSGPWNMSVDEALLESAQRQAGPCLRFYAWTPATLSIGYFQSTADRTAHDASRDLPLVRRATGGGAIIHHHEITYSFAVASNRRSDADSQRLYLAFHETARDVLKSYAIEAQLWERTGRSRDDGPFLCFLRRSPGDLVVAHQKVLGSAQRRARGGLVQHGSLILGRSPHAPEIGGLSVSERPFASDESHELRTRWCERIGDRLGLVWKRSDLSDLEYERARKLRTEKFDSAPWTDRRASDGGNHTPDDDTPEGGTR